MIVWACLATLTPLLVGICLVEICDSIQKLREEKKEDETLWVHRSSTDGIGKNERKKRFRPRHPRK